MHDGYVRTSITLEEDVYQIAKLYAKGRGLTLGAAIGQLIQKPAVFTSRINHAPNGFPLLPRTGRVITPDLVKELSEDEVA